MSGTRVAVTLGEEWVEVLDAAATVSTLGMILEDGGLRGVSCVAAGSHAPSSSPHSPKRYSPAHCRQEQEGVTSQSLGNKEGCQSGVILREAKETWSPLRLMRISMGKGDAPPRRF